jgi:hypothetical protein
MTAIIAFDRFDESKILSSFNVSCPTVTSAISFSSELLAKEVGVPFSIKYRDGLGDDVLIWEEAGKGRRYSENKSYYISLVSKQIICLCDRYGVYCDLITKEKASARRWGLAG